MTQITFVWGMCPQLQRQVAWPSVPRKGDWVQLDEEGETLNVYSVDWLWDGSAVVTLR